jgi:hypothetical protein
MIRRTPLNADAVFRMLAGVAVCCLADMRVSTAQEIKTSAIQGSVFIAGKTPHDPPRQEPKSTHAYVTLNGPGALAIYKNMKAREREDICRGDGWKYKSERNLVCAISRNGRQAECDFSINLTSGQMGQGRPC